MDKTTEALIKADDALDAIGKRDLASALDELIRAAAKKQKPRHKVGDKVSLKEDTPLPVTAVKVDPRFGACYEVKLGVMERDLREPQEAEADDGIDKGVGHGSDTAPAELLRKKPTISWFFRF